MKKKLSLTALFIGVFFIATTTVAQTVVPFSLRYQNTIRGSIDFVSNTNIQCDGTGSGGANCVDLATQAPPATATWSQNNDHVAEYIDIDGDAGTFSSSADSLNLQNCSGIVFAGIYWGGRSDNIDPGYAARNSILIEANGGEYIPITADEIIDAGVTEGITNKVYYCFADITTLVKSNPVKSLYTVANVYSLLQGDDNRWGGWNIVVVYEDETEPLRTLNVFDGYTSVGFGGHEVEVSALGILTPSTGPVSFEIGFVGFDGDRGFGGDVLEFDGGLGYNTVSNTLNPLNDLFNSSQTDRGELSTSQIPRIDNNISIDADMFKPDNSGFSYISNAATSAGVKVSSVEPFDLTVVILTVDVAEPDLRTKVSVEDINGDLVELGDTLEYTVVGKNIGLDASNNTFIDDTIGINNTYVPNSIEIVFGPNTGTKTDGVGDDQAEFILVDNLVRVNIGTGATAVSGGELLNSTTGLDSTMFTFRTVVTENCVNLVCNNIIDNQAFIYGAGATTGNIITHESVSGLNSGDGCPILGPTSIAVDNTACSVLSDTTVAVYCGGVEFSEFPYDEYGYSYFNSVFTGVTEATSSGFYYAIANPYVGCSDTILINVSSFFTAPSTAFAGTDQTGCSFPGVATITADNPPIGTGMWTVSTGGATIISPLNFTSEVTGLTVGVNTFVWTVSNGVDCPPSTDEVIINVVEGPTPSNAGTDQNVCASTTVTLAGNNPLIGTGMWTVTAGGGVVTNPGDFDSGVTGLTPGLNTFVWTISNGIAGCSDMVDDVSIVVGVDTDQDGICDQFDLDNDNDGIPNIQEYDCYPLSFIPFNTPSYPLDTEFNSGPIASGSIANIIEYVNISEPSPTNVDFNFRLEGAVNWNGGVELKSLAGINPDGGYVNVRSENTDFPNGELAVFELVFSEPVYNLEFKWGGLDLEDAVSFEAELVGLPIVLNTDNIENINIPDANFSLIGNKVVSDAAIGNAPENSVLVNIPGPVSKVIISGGKDNGSSSPSTMQLFEMTYCAGLNSDEDAILNHLDRDSDNDGLTDVLEAGGVDLNGDGIIDGFTDVDLNGLDDNTELIPLPNSDSDQDGLANSIDLDSDNDGTPDIIEAAGVDTGADGVLDVITDGDNDGLADLVDTDDGGTALENPDTDNDLVDDRIDLDSDNDGLSDILENGGDDGDNNGVIDGFSDIDNDGFGNSVDTDNNTILGPDDGGTRLSYADFDLDNIPNSLDLDTDGDGIVDAIEASGTDIDGDGKLDGFVDADNDGFSDVVDTDDNTTIDLLDGAGIALVIVNSDGTGGPNHLDIDSDGDGIPDNIEGQGSFSYSAPLNLDTDGDGIDDAYDIDNLGDPINPVNYDLDADPDYLDLDTDNDGELDALEGHDLDGSNLIEFPENIATGSDTDQDGLDDAFDAVILSDVTANLNGNNNTVDPLTEGIIADADTPGFGNLDFRQLDSDNDGVDDGIDIDNDNDGLLDSVEGDLTDTDGDGIIDRLDLDSDNDGMPDIIEAYGLDMDGDGVVDDITDSDGDGYADIFDLDDGGTELLNLDTDLDGIDDRVDLDSDNDGATDLYETGGEDLDNNGIVDDLTDFDGDGFADIYDTDNGTAIIGIPLDYVDSDFDGLENFVDLDSDDDGIPDLIENGGLDADRNGYVDDATDSDLDGFADVHDPDDGGIPLLRDDFDLDGLENYIDLDSDNDGITDLIEAGGVDIDFDGFIDDLEDGDVDGLLDLVDPDQGGVALSLDNTDGTGNPNYLDIDSDGDGIIDNIEGQPTVDYNLPTGLDSDEDGIDDTYDVDDLNLVISPIDVDSDLIPDYIDLDSDNDGEPDLLEGHDLNGSNSIDGLEAEPVDLDSDNDGLDNAFDSVVLSLATSATNAANGTIDPLGDGVIANADSPSVGKLDFRESDYDEDGVDDISDLDSDNDGILDSDEGFSDSDNDGIADNLDLDSDNDGIPDIVEAGGEDTDGNGVIDGFTDANSDGLDDAIALTPLANIDIDGDDIWNAIDLDSDNDGTPDIIEAGGVDTDGNGRQDDVTDTDEDGLVDIVDLDDGGTTLFDFDTDSDGLENRIDLDSDNDGIADLIENGGIDTDGNGILEETLDSDGDGFADIVDTDDDAIAGFGDGAGISLPMGDHDQDGILNMVDLDSDNDGITDLIEAGGTDTNTDGIIDGFLDGNNNGFSDNVDSNAGGTPLNLPNSDADGNLNYLDIDADGDGIIDNIESQLTTNYQAPTGIDSDNDGLDNQYDIDGLGFVIQPYDLDGDAIPDYLDLDTDNDGETDLLEGHDLDGNNIIEGEESEPSGLDTDGDGLDNSFDTIVLTELTSGLNGSNGTIDPLTEGILADADAPGFGDLDFRELDSDNDGILDGVDVDDDNDGIEDLVEDRNEDGDANPITNPTDTDGDLIPDYLDLDADNDGIADIVEAGGIDTNNDGLVDNLLDADLDGLVNDYDTDDGGLTIPNLNTDEDENPDFQDLDSDNDEIKDIIEDGGVDFDNNGEVDSWLDSDMDGIPNTADVDQTAGIDSNTDGIDDAVQIGLDTDDDGIADTFDADSNGDGWEDNDFTNGLENTDGDSLPNRIDLDSDNDGIADITEGIEDTDTDGIVNYKDLDSDNDGISDAQENGLPDLDSDGIIDDFTDVNIDGWDDVNQIEIQIDTDNDGIADALELDADADGIFDIVEAAGGEADADGIVDDFMDIDNNGLQDGGGLLPIDTDGDGIDDYKDLDADADSVPDEIENDPNQDGQGPDDTDSDGIADYRDTNDDNDGILTIDESEIVGTGYKDCDGDGIPDYLDPDICRFVIPDGFSPDGDGINDFFVIQGIQAYPQAALVVFNRWGNRVFEASGGYTNDWDGTNQNSAISGNRELPVGTYFYILDLGDGGEAIKGSVFINK